MKYSKQYLVDLCSKTNFIKDNLEKVLRLNEILKFLNSDEELKDKLALKGGTAINLTAVKLPRLSVDIDLDYTFNIDVTELGIEKKNIKDKIIKYMTSEDYFISKDAREHYALLSFIFSYINNAGNRDNIKIEINFMDRCHILPLVKKDIYTGDILQSHEILTLNEIELYASKINALICRATPRDLYDVYAMIQNDVIKDKALLKKCLIFYNMIGGEQNVDSLDYNNVKSINFMKFKTQLKPVLSKSDKFNLEEAKDITINYVKELLKFDYKEIEFIDQFRSGQYKPELLFEDMKIVTRIVNHPMAKWRVNKYEKSEL
ncbi:MAG: nucleotidyl transferase AbiEii/AbiGii toxin family protein [Acholeplasmatales bacterium]|nr:nucleotidyl transferase AbiEii/AbiGii toxin family protein [Acholeplasmatales bacterium]